MTLNIITATTNLREDLRGALSHSESRFGVYTVGAVGRSGGFAAVTAMAKSLDIGSQSYEVTRNHDAVYLCGRLSLNLVPNVSADTSPSL